MLFEIFGESLNRRLNGPTRSIAQRAKRLALDVVAEIEHQLRVLETTATVIDPFENFHEPVSAFTTRRTPPARLVFIKLSQIFRRLEDVTRLVHHDEPTRAHTRSSRNESFVIHAHIFADDLIGAHDVDRRAARNHGFELLAV